MHFCVRTLFYLKFLPKSFFKKRLSFPAELPQAGWARLGTQQGCPLRHQLQTSKVRGAIGAISSFCAMGRRWMQSTVTLIFSHTNIFALEPRTLAGNPSAHLRNESPPPGKHGFPDAGGANQLKPKVSSEGSPLTNHQLYQGFSVVNPPLWKDPRLARHFLRSERARISLSVCKKAWSNGAMPLGNQRHSDIIA